MRRQTAISGINTAGSSRSLRLDPHSLPLRYHARDIRADGGIRQIELDRDRVQLARMPHVWRELPDMLSVKEVDALLGGVAAAGAWALTAEREVAEETGIVLGSAGVPREALWDWQIENVYEIYPVWRHRYAPGVTHNTERVFGLEVPRDTPITLAPREHTQHVWLPWHEAADRCFSPSNAEAILQLPTRVAGFA